MANVTNKHVTALGLPGGPVIPAGRTVRVERWDNIKDHDVTRAWLAAGLIVEDVAVAEPATKAKASSK